MANRRDEERERLRQARQQRESKEDRSGKMRVYAVYAVAGIIGLLVLGGLVSVIASSGGDGDSSDAHILQATGSTNAFEPDDREGVEVAAAKQTNLEKAAKEAGCVLRLELKDEGKTHLPPTPPTPDHETNPPPPANPPPPPPHRSDPRLRNQPADLRQPRRTALPAGRRRLQRDARRNLHRPHARARPHGDPVQPRPVRGGAAGTEGALRHDVRWDAALPQPRDGLRGGGDHLDQPARLSRVQRSGDPRRDPRLRQRDLGQIRRRARQRVRAQRPDPGRTRQLGRSAVGGEVTGRLAAGGEAVVRLAVADDLRRVPGLLAVGEAALELLEGVAAGDAAAEVERQPLRGGVLG